MESIQLAKFLQEIAHWPSGETELNAVAQNLRTLLRAPFGAFYSVIPEEKIGFHVTDGALAGIPNGVRFPDILKELLKTHLAKASTAKAPELMSQIRIAGDRAAGVAGSSTFPAAIFSGNRAGGYLTLVPISAELKVQPGVHEVRERQDFGWLVVGTPDVLDAREELLLFSAARRLTELAQISHFEGMLQLGSQFLSIASHELKTPLTAIYGVLQLQERMLRLSQVGPDAPAPSSPEKQHSYLKMVIRQVERLNELIDGLLDVSRIQNGRFMVEPCETDVAAVLNEMISGRLSVIAHEAGVRIQIDAPPGLRASVDPMRIEEVITNLVMNAIRFSPEGGMVWVKLRDENGAFRLMVRDQGPAVSDEDRERIFQPFERAQRTSRLGGLGLGLFISRQIAQLHGGNVTLVESIPGKGNLFEAYFPTRVGMQAISA